MKVCPFCNAQLDDNAAFCAVCGAKLDVAPAAQPQPDYTAQAQPQYAPPPPQYNAVPPYVPAAPEVDPYDHTSEFDEKDISDNKVISMLVYLLGPIGIVIALLASSTSPYAAFHVRQALKFTVVTTLMWLCAAVLCWTFIVPIAAAIMSTVLWVIKVICFFQICSGKAKEPAIIRSLKFLK